MAQEPADKKAEFWEQVYHMHPFGKGAPYISDFEGIGEVTDKLPANYPAGSKRHPASVLNVVASNNEPTHAGIYWCTVRAICVQNHLKGDPVEFFTIDPSDGKLTVTVLGVDTEHGHTYIYKPGNFVAYRMKDRKKDAYALMNCVHIPGYVDGDFEHHLMEEMVEKFPQHKKIIEELGKLE